MLKKLLPLSLCGAFMLNDNTLASDPQQEQNERTSYSWRLFTQAEIKQAADKGIKTSAANIYDEDMAHLKAELEQFDMEERARKCFYGKLMQVYPPRTAYERVLAMESCTEYARTLKEGMESKVNKEPFFHYPKPPQ